MGTHRVFSVVWPTAAEIGRKKSERREKEEREEGISLKGHRARIFLPISSRDPDFLWGSVEQTSFLKRKMT